MKTTDIQSEKEAIVNETFTEPPVRPPRNQRKIPLMKVVAGDPPLREDYHQQDLVNRNQDVIVTAKVYDDQRIVTSMMSRQRHPALFLSSAAHSKVQSSPSSIPQPRRLSQLHSNGGNLIPPSSFWTADRFPSESEFDTTRLDTYIHNFGGRNSFICHHKLPRKPRVHARSKSVDRISGRIRHNNIHLHRHLHHSRLDTSKTHDEGQDSYKLNISRLVSTLKATAISAANRALVIPRSDSLNSSDPDSGSTSGDNDVETPFKATSSSTSTEPPKSALKKTISSSSTGAQHLSSKNVTFSAFATVQVVK